MQEKSVSILVEMTPTQRRRSVDATSRLIEAGLPSRKPEINAKKTAHLLSFDPSKDISSNQFISVAETLVRDFTPWVHTKLGLDQNGRMPGGLRMEGTDPTTGKQFDFTEIMSINTEESCFEYCYGRILFIILNDYNT